MNDKVLNEGRCIVCNEELQMQGCVLGPDCMEHAERQQIALVETTVDPALAAQAPKTKGGVPCMDVTLDTVDRTGSVVWIPRSIFGELIGEAPPRQPLVFVQAGFTSMLKAMFANTNTSYKGMVDFHEPRVH